MTISKTSGRLALVLAASATLAALGGALGPPAYGRSATQVAPARQDQTAVMALPAANPVRLAEAEKAATTPDAQGAAVSAADTSGAALATELRSRLDMPPPEVLAPVPPRMDSTRSEAEAKALAREHEALSRFYAARKDTPVWVTPDGLTEKARSLAAALRQAPAYGLDLDLLPIPQLDRTGRTAVLPATPAAVPLPVSKSQAAAAAPTSNTAAGTPAEDAAATAKPSAEALAVTELAFSRAALVYARHARGGRILYPAAMLNSNLDRKPQLWSPIVVMADLAESDDMAAALARLHPIHPQFELLRQAYLEETGSEGKGKLSAKAKRLRANMEFWRWMWDDLGALYIFNNIPEFMQTVVRRGEVIRREKIVVGEIGKQSSVYSRPLKEVVLRPRWRVPESIMVHELWPSLRRGGGLMRQHGLEISTKSGEPRDWRQIDWTKDDIRNYHVWQAPGRKSALGFVKFSFPSQHTIFMHDTPDKWMFNRGQRTLSHGCLRLKNPMELTEIVLDHDRGWDRDKIKELIRSGPLDNKVEMTKHIPVHLAYFTAWADDDGKVRYFRDIYGHERRVTQALDGDWQKVNKGRNHLAKPVPRFGGDAVASTAPTRKSKKQPASVADLISDAFGF